MQPGQCGFLSSVTVFNVCMQVLQRPTADQKQHLAACSKRVAGAVTELIQTAEAMKGNGQHTHMHTHNEHITSLHTLTHFDSHVTCDVVTFISLLPTKCVKPYLVV